MKRKRQAPNPTKHMTPRELRRLIASLDVRNRSLNLEVAALTEKVATQYSRGFQDGWRAGDAESKKQLRAALGLES